MFRQINLIPSDPVRFNWVNQVREQKHLSKPEEKKAKVILIVVAGLHRENWIMGEQYAHHVAR